MKLYVILPEWKIAAGVAALVLAQAGAAAAGAVANGLRLDAVHQHAVASENSKRFAIEKRLGEKSAGVGRLGAEKQAAEERRQAAEKSPPRLRGRSAAPRPPLTASRRTATA